MNSMNIYDAVKIALKDANSGFSSKVYFAARLMVTTKDGNEFAFQLFADSHFTPADILGAEVEAGRSVALLYVHDVKAIRTVNQVNNATRWIEIEITTTDDKVVAVACFLPDGVEFPAEVQVFQVAA
jgi:hypothetical protein